MNTNDFDPSALAKSPILASALGSLVGMRFAPGPTVGARIVNGISGFAGAIYFTQLLVWWMKLEHVGAIAGLSFVVGILGMVVVDAVVQGLRETKIGEFFNAVLSRIALLAGSNKEEPKP